MSDTGLRDRKRLDATRAIAAAALRLAWEHGPDAVTVADIAAAADVSPRTVFNHFATKDDAILGHHPGRGQALREAIEAQPPGLGPLDAVRAALVEAIRQVDDLGTTWRQRAEVVNRYPSLLPAQLAAHAALEEEVAAAVAARTGLDPEVDLLPRLVAAVSLTAVRTAFAHAANADDTDDGDPAARADAAISAVRDL
jgi:AcrR family transcriptional regulator